ncbi:MAG: heparinase II/III family protein [Niabella sp.]
MKPILSHCRINVYFTILLFLYSASGFAQYQGSATSYNYGQIKQHPRLLLNKGEENAVQQAIQKSPELGKIDAYIKNEADKLIAQEPLTYKKEGKRLLAVSRKALTRLYYLSYSYRMTKDKKYLYRAQKELEAVCSFENWNPTHFLDVGEMCMGVAIAYDWLYNDLPATTKAIARKAILENAFAASDNKSDAWFLDAHSNWNSVCNAGLVFGALAVMDEEKEKSIAIIERSLKSNVLPLKAFAPDGNYPEGPGYWNYGTSFEVMLIAALESALGSDNGLSQSPGFYQSAYYMLFAQGASGFYFNYYDCGRAVAPSPTMFWFAGKLKDPSLICHEIPLIKSGRYTNGSSDDERILPNALVFAKNIDLSKAVAPSQKIFTGNGITPVCIVRTNWNNHQGRYLGIKGGMASDGHAHMDQGTFVYDAGGLRWAMDLGLQSYITLESKGVDLWNMSQNSQRWDIFRYNNLNHNTLTINNQRHNINGKANIIETYKEGNELGAKVDLTPVLNLNDELKLATRKATIVGGAYLKIEDVLETGSKPVDLRWNMVTPAIAKIVDKQTIKLSQQGKEILVEFKSDIPFNLVIRPSENPAKYKCEFGNYNYGDYNQTNPGTVMIGFDAKIPDQKKSSFTVVFEDVQTKNLLKKNTIVLDAPNPSSASEGDRLYHDSSPIGISQSGAFEPLEEPDWFPYGQTDIGSVLGKSFSFKISAKRITASGVADAGIDRSADGQLGIRGGDGNGIDPKEGHLLGLDLRNVPPSVSFTITKIMFTGMDGSKSCTVVSRAHPDKMMMVGGNGTNKTVDLQITENLKRRFTDVSDLKLTLKGGGQNETLLSIFNTGEAGGFRIAGFEMTLAESR